MASCCDKIIIDAVATNQQTHRALFTKAKEKCFLSPERK